MPSLNIDLDFFDHPKTKRLKAMLGPAAAIYLIQLWVYAGKYHTEDGLFKKYMPDEVASFAGYHGKGEKMLQAMLQAGFIEKAGRWTKGCRWAFVVRNWTEHEGHLVNFRLRAKMGSEARWAHKRNSIINESKKNNASSNASSNALSNASSNALTNSTCSTVQKKKRESGVLRKDNDIATAPPAETASPALPAAPFFPEEDILSVGKAYCKLRCPGFAENRTYLLGRQMFFAAKELLRLNAGDVKRAVLCLNHFAEYYADKNKTDWHWNYVLEDFPKWDEGMRAQETKEQNNVK